jgi:hypothetical protein
MSACNRINSIFITYLLHGAGHYLESWLSLSLSKNVLLSYGTRRFITVFTKSRYRTLSKASSIQCAPFPLLRSCQRISLGLGRFGTLRNNINFYGEGLLTSTKPKAGGPSLVSCPRLLIQYIRSYPPYLEPFPPSATRGRATLYLRYMRNLLIVDGKVRYICPCA